MSSKWSRRRTRDLAEEVTRFLEGLGEHPELRRRLLPHGYTEQTHRELQACLARVGGSSGTGAARGPRDEASWRGATRAVGGWVAEQLAVAGQAATKLPTVAQEAARLFRTGRRQPVRALEGSQRLYRRVRRDEHLSHFLTLSGLRDARDELRQRLLEGGAREPVNQRHQARSELAFLFARWRSLCLQIFVDEPAALRALGLVS